MLTFLSPYTTPLLLALGVAVAALGVVAFRLWHRWNLVFGRAASTGESLGAELGKRLAAAEMKLRGLEPRMEQLEDIAPRSIQKVGFLRFNPFERTGGDQSFVVALLDRDDNGIVISSLYTRDGVRVYAKEIRDGTSKHALSNEEQQALQQAISEKS